MIKKDLDIALSFLDRVFELDQGQREMLTAKISQLSDKSSKDFLELLYGYSEQRKHNMKNMITDLKLKTISLEEEMDNQGLLAND